jgi:hypothetical protein
MAKKLEGSMKKEKGDKDVVEEEGKDGEKEATK